MSPVGLFILNIIDFIWIPIGWFAVPKPRRLYILVFTILCSITLRLEAQIFESAGFETGLTGLMEGLTRGRGLLVYSVMTVIYIAVLNTLRCPLWAVLTSWGAALYLGGLILSMTLMMI